MAEERTIAEAQAYPEWLLERERKALSARRGSLPEEIMAAGAPQVGLALSGGGIRSATFSLGFVQALARSGVLPRVDYLSTVSGGGYIGAFLGALYARGASAQEVMETLTRFPESRQLKWLRSNGRFLAPNGAGASWLAGAVLLRNWLSLLFVVAPVAFCLSFLGALVRAVVAEALVNGGYQQLSSLGVGGLALSPLVALPVLSALYWMLPSWLAYWMVNAGHLKSLSRLLSGMVAVLGLLAPLGVAYYHRDQPWRPFAVVLGIVAVTAFAFFSAAWLRWRLQLRGGVHASFNPFGPDRDNIARNKLSEWLKGGFMAVALTSLLALLDTLGFAAFQTVRNDRLLEVSRQLATLATGAAAVVLATHRILAKLGSKREGSRIPVQLLIAPTAVLLILLGHIVVATATYWIAVPGSQPNAQPERWVAGLGAVASFLVMAVLGRFVVFVNQSSLGPIYNARLTRAYVGASNPNRWAPESPFKGKESPTEPIPGDQIPWDAYHPQAAGGPLHLINVTVNETVDPRVQLHQPDRKGMIMAVGAMGVSLGVRHHAAWDGNAPAPDPSVFQVFPTGKELVHAERLSVGHWVAISGAAVATGLGQLSRWGASLLCGVFNVRLGYWWISNVGAHRPHQAKAASIGASLMTVFGLLFPVYRLLAAEFLGRFPGTAIESWYLTDGGHLENTGCYELLRRRVPFIICADNGADPNATCSDLGNLVRLARVDFGADVEFLDEAQLSAVLDPAVVPYFGAIQNLKHKEERRGAYAALARVHYSEGKVSWLVVVKPALIGSEPVDINAYGLAHSDFPQQSTGDQSFDDAQWEVYRKLGDHIGTKLFGTKGQLTADRWWPRWLDQQALDLLGRQYAPDSAVHRRAQPDKVPAE